MAPYDEINVGIFDTSTELFSRHPVPFSLYPNHRRRSDLSSGLGYESAATDGSKVYFSGVKHNILVVNPSNTTSIFEVHPRPSPTWKLTFYLTGCSCNDGRK